MLIKSFLVTMALLVALPAATPAGAQSFSTDAFEDWLLRAQSLPSQTDGKEPEAEAVALLGMINANVSTTEAIQAFRSWPRDDELVSALIPYAAGAFPVTRIPATRILGNVVDNTNVCLVIAHLQNDAEATIDGRYNLLQVVRQVSNYAWQDTGTWIDNLVEISLPAARADTNLANTARLLDQIRSILRGRTVGQDDLLRDLSPIKFQKCTELLDAEIPVGNDTAAFDLTVAQIDAQVIRDRLFSAERRKFAEFLVAEYQNAAEAQRGSLVSSLLDAMIAPETDSQRRYRVNLYIALTFSMLPAGTLDEAGLRRLTDLRGFAEMGDPTFRQNVENAIRRQTS